MVNLQALPPIKILVVDDERVNRSILTHYLEKLGQKVIVAENGSEAIRLFRDEAPDVIIMDVIMPGMDGYEATRRIKEISGNRWIPVIFASALTTPEEQIKGLEAGGDDYLTKPVNFGILASKIRAMQRISVMQNVLSDALLELEQYRRKTEEELDMARHIMHTLTRDETLAEEGVAQFRRAVGAFSGDVVAAARTPDGMQYILLADVTGHGLSSALNAIPLVDVFYEFAGRGVTPEDLCRRMNSKLKRIIPAGYFVAAALAAIDRGGRTIRVWNGGLPPVMFITRSGDVARIWESHHLALGILDESQFDGTLEAMDWDEPGHLVMLTDGITEAVSATGEAFGQERLVDLLREAPEGNRVGHVESKLMEFLDGAEPHDDISLIAVSCGLSSAGNNPVRNRKVTR